jgi:kumamolisin
VQGANTCVAIVELGGGWTTQNLTSTFGRIGQPNPTVVDVSVDGGVNDPTDISNSAEVMLDIYCAAAVAPAAKMAVYFSPNSFQGWLDIIIAATNDTVNNPSVISNSWLQRDTVWPALYRTAFDSALQAAIVKGITTFSATGDFGVRVFRTSPAYTVSYPASSPYNVGAGGTVVTINNDYTIALEAAWSMSNDLYGQYASGGGVSKRYAVPQWQQGLHTTTYPAPGVTATLTGRGIPDVSAMAIGYLVYYGNTNTQGTLVGTSAVAPLLAGMTARINSITNQRIGFVNALWYANTSAFNDITVGDNHSAAAPYDQGYQATVGWDGCTGLGSPIGVNILALYQPAVGVTYPQLLVGSRPATCQTYPRSIIRA